jgi:hypothetical protein
MVAPNPVDVLTRRVRHALGDLLFTAFTSEAAGEVEPHPAEELAALTDRQRYRLDVLATVTFGFAWAPPLLAIAITTAFEWYGRHEEPVARFAEAIRTALAEMVPHLAGLVERGDLDPEEGDLGLVRGAADGRSERQDAGPTVEKAIRLYRGGASAPWRRLYEADCRTPYTVPVAAATIYAVLIRPCGYDEDDWEYDLGTLSPDLATLRRRFQADVGEFCDDVPVGLAEVSLVPAAAWEAGARQTDVCDAAVRAAGGVESYDLHSFNAAGAGISEIVSDFPIDPHPAGLIARTATVRLVLVRQISLDASGCEGRSNA